MNLFDQLVNEALQNNPQIAQLRIVVEKELLHHSVLKILSEHKLLANLTFIGGTCLRCCYGGVRLSEDLDFTGGSNFTCSSLSNMAQTLTQSLEEKYGLKVNISEPTHKKGNVDTWQIKIDTRPAQKHLPLQRINLDICAIPSYEKQPMLLINHYGIDLGTSGLIVQAESREEIYADKLIAFTLRPNRIKYRDLWDIIWLHQNGITPNLKLITKKIADHKREPKEFMALFNQRYESLINDAKQEKEFYKEMQRFLPPQEAEKVIAQKDFWLFLSNLIKTQGEDIKKQCGF